MRQLLYEGDSVCFSLDFVPYSLYYNAMLDHGKTLTEEGKPCHVHHPN
jgi:hypothetical protein